MYLYRLRTLVHVWRAVSELVVSRLQVNGDVHYVPVYGTPLSLDHCRARC